MFSGLLYCADCGAKLYFCTCNTYKDDSQNHFVCSNYKSNTGSCQIHYIREQVLYRIVLESIQRTLTYVRETMRGITIHSSRANPRISRSFMASRMYPNSSRIAGKYRSVTETATMSF